MEPVNVILCDTNVLDAAANGGTPRITHPSQPLPAHITQTPRNSVVNIRRPVPAKKKKSGEGEVRLICTACGSSFKKQFLLDRHMKSHSDVRPFKCPHCEKCFTDNSILKKHLAVHSDYKPHMCDQCDAAFRQAYNLVIHKRRHTGEKPHTCATCGKAFAQPGAYHEHLRIHTDQRPYKCDVDKCTASFSRRYSLTIHKRVHASERPFQCDECDAAFVDNSSLSRHMRIHTGEKPYVCSVCNKGFNQSGSLKVHSRTHNSSNPSKPMSSQEPQSKKMGPRLAGTDGNPAAAAICHEKRPCHQDPETTIAVVAQTIVQSWDSVPSGTSEIELRII